MKQLSVFLLLFFFCITAKAQIYDPLTLSKRIFSRDTMPELPKYSTGEYQGHPNGRDLSPGLNTSFELLQQTTNTAVVAITLSNNAGIEYNGYLHFKRDTIWKLEAFRALAMTGMIEEMNAELAKMTPVQIDSVIASKPQKGKDDRPFKSKAEYRFLLDNSALTITSDQKLIAHFNQHRELFEQLKNGLVVGGIVKAHDLKQMKNAASLRLKARKLLIDNVSTVEENSGLDFLIGGITDNAVGYLYFKNEKDVPEMSPGSYIMIRKLGNGWYLYKTT